MAEIKLYKFTETLYDIVGDKIREFCDKTYYSEIVCSFEQSYDGVEWTKETEFAFFENCTELWFENDWNEGQKYLRNLRIWHLEDSAPIKHGRWIDNKVAFHRVCSECGAVIRQDISLVYLLECMEKVGHLNYCPNCGALMDEVEEMNELISDEVAKKIIEEANKACAKCKELNCEECEYRFWRDPLIEKEMN